MAVKDLFTGSRYKIVAWVDEEGNCAVEDYILELYNSNNSDAEAITHLMDTTSNHGITHNQQKIRVWEGLIEFKARGGTRILGFIVDETKIIVCSHGIPKLKDKRFQREVSKLKAIKESYECEVLLEDSDNEYIN